MGWPQVIVLLVAAQRSGELVLAHRNTARLLALGAWEAGAAHYPLFIVLHAGWLAVLFLVTPAGVVPDPVWLALFVVLQAGRVWVIAALGARWTTRVIVVPAAALVRRGPFRWLRHPNYLIVGAELIVLPLSLDQPWIAVVATVLNLPLTLHRVRVEDAALSRALIDVGERMEPVTRPVP